jgi:bifunctional non-homologous end joining protein LigD
LKTYEEKRDFSITAEPSPEAPAPSTTGHQYMIHKHDATRLHYDLRLENDGVLASWACPKGPSYDPAAKHLAIEVEDHPLAYGGFEGRIPDGEYGAGDSLIWDRGLYETVPPGQFAEQKKKGHLHLVFVGEKLHGGWHLVRTRPAGTREQWLFFKAHDGTERPDYDVLADRPESVESGRRTTRGPVHHAKPGVTPRSLLAKVFPPMLATLSDGRPTPDAQYLFEVKYDGFRALAGLSGHLVSVLSRNELDLLERFPFLREAFKGVSVTDAVIDGELIALDEKGVSDFQRMGGQGSHRFVAFDLLWLDGQDLRARPLEERRELLESVIGKPADGAVLTLAERVDGPMEAALAKAKAQRWEGVIAKRRGSVYSNTRSLDWLKLKVLGSEELTIAGWTAHSARDDEIGALLLAAQKGGAFTYAGKVGTGFDQAMRQKLLTLLAPHERETAAVEGAPRMRDAHWVEPGLVAQVKFTEWTHDGRLRHPVFQGLRDDKGPEELGQDRPRPEVKVSHPDKVMFPKLGYTKADVRTYIEAVAPAMVPALFGRPLSFQQFPSGIGKPGFFRHDAQVAPDWVQKLKIKHSDRVVANLLIDSPESLYWLTNQSALTIHIPSSRADTLLEPDWVAFDFDPVDGGWKDLITLVQALHSLLDELKLPSVPKTSGKRGLHVFVPIGPGHTHEQAVGFANAVTGVLAEKFKAIATVERMKRNRSNRLYLDAGQNGLLRTVVAPYSIRAVEEATVSTPLAWDEVTEALDPLRFTLKTVPQRLAKLGDLFAPALRGTARLPDFST